MKKKILSAALALAMALSLVPAAFAAGGTAYASTQSVEVDGKKVEFQMYALRDANGNPTNYVKLRDVAHVLNGTKAQFAVGYDGSISVTTGTAYTDVGGEMSTPYSGDRAYRTGSGSVKVNGADTALDSIILTDDAGGDYTYFKLRDLGSALGFKVDWDAQRGVIVETGETSLQPSVPVVKPVTEFTLEDLQGIWYAEMDGLFQMEISINGNQLSQTYLDADGGCLYEIATIVAVEKNYRDPDNSEITPLYLELKNETETSVSDGTVKTINHETSQRYFYDYPGEVGVFATGTGVPFRRASTLKLYPQYETTLAAAQSKPSTPGNNSTPTYSKLTGCYNKMVDPWNGGKIWVELVISYATQADLERMTIESASDAGSWSKVRSAEKERAEAIRKMKNAIDDMMPCAGEILTAAKEYPDIFAELITTTETLIADAKILREDTFTTAGGRQFSLDHIADGWLKMSDDMDIALERIMQYKK